MDSQFRELMLLLGREMYLDKRSVRAQTWRVSGRGALPPLKYTEVQKPTGSPIVDEIFCR
ncbi:MAG: hypothetical protein WCB11_24925 [Terriglobales bacterium]